MKRRILEQGDAATVRRDGGDVSVFHIYGSDVPRSSPAMMHSVVFPQPDGPERDAFAGCERANVIERTPEGNVLPI